MEYYSRSQSCSHVHHNTKINVKTKQSANGAINNANSKQDLAAFLHACTFSPQPSTLLQAIEHGHLTSWSGLTSSLFKKHLPKSLATSQGHLRMQQQNIQSTKITLNLPIETSLDLSPSQEPNNARTNVVFTALLPTTDLNKSYSDQTGRYPSSTLPWISIRHDPLQLRQQCHILSKPL